MYEARYLCGVLVSEVSPNISGAGPDEDEGIVRDYERFRYGDDGAFHSPCGS